MNLKNVKLREPLDRHSGTSCSATCATVLSPFLSSYWLVTRRIAILLTSTVHRWCFGPGCRIVHVRPWYTVGIRRLLLDEF